MNLMELLHKAGYEAIAIGDEIPPCTLLRDGEPIGFLKSDLTTAVTTDRIDLQPELNAMVSFSLEYHDRPTLETGESILSQYEDYTFAVDYDFYDQKPYYCVYQGKGDDRKILASGESKDEIAQAFVQESKLAELPKQPKPVYEPKHMAFEVPTIFKRLQEAVQAIGLKLRIYFGMDAPKAIIQQDNRTVATVDQNLSVQYSQRTDDDLKARIEAVIQQVREELSREAAEQDAPLQQQEVSQQQPELQEKIPEKSKEQEKEITPQAAAPSTITVSPAEQEKRQALLAQFQQYHAVLEMAKGFGGEMAQKAHDDCVAQFGTADLKEFTEKLERGDYTTLPQNFSERLEQAKQEANRRNHNREGKAPQQEQVVTK
jgi:hypothetical protein